MSTADVRIVINYQGATGGGTPTGNPLFTAKTQAQMAKTIIPVGSARGMGALMDMDTTRGIGGNTVYATVNGTIIKGETFVRLLSNTVNSEVILNLLDMTEGETSDSILLVQAIGATSGATGGDPTTIMTLTKDQILGFTGGILG
jgi:hypothetical protein